MPDAWSPAEVAATVADYLDMLELELRDEPYSKRGHNRNLQQQLNGRSAGAIEFKHGNISAVLNELGYPCIDGYKPRENYQQLLVDELATQLELRPQIPALVSTVVDATISAPPLMERLITTDLFVDPPVAKLEKSIVYDRPARVSIPRKNVNYLEREARNASLGLAGEMLIVLAEQRRLHDAGKRTLSNRVEHVSRTKGDGLGYDILSFELDGRERLIEVKTTAFGKTTPFFASRREVQVSSELGRQYHLYRLFKFREAPKAFILNGSLRDTCRLDPSIFEATAR